MRTIITTILSFSVASLFAIPPHAESPKVVESILTRHQWTLVEIMQNNNDTITNMTLFLTPCEKDNFVSYAGDGTYQIHDGVNKCSTSGTEVKGEGTWSYSTDDSTLLDSYEGGRKVSKKVLALSDGVFRVQYFGEAKKQFTLTYFSEEGQKDDANKDLIFDNSDASQNITKLIRDYLASVNYYVIASRKDFQDGRRSTEDDKSGLKPTVFIMPFSDASKEVVNAAQRNEQLIAQAKKSDIDYVITGDLKSVDAKKDNNKDNKDGYVSTVKYDLYVLDVANGAPNTKTKTIDSDKPDQVKKSGPSLGTILNAVAVIGAVGYMYHPGYYGYNHYYCYGCGYGYYNHYYYNRDYYYSYNSLFYAQRAASAAVYTASVFNDVNDAERTDNMKKNNATITAVNKTSNGVLAFVSEHTAPQIKINSIDGDGSKARMIIEAGSNIGLDKGDKLSVMQTVGTGQLQIRKEIGTLEIEDLAQSSGAYCKISKGKSDVLKAYKDSPATLTVMPQLKQQEEKKD